METLIRVVVFVFLVGGRREFREGWGRWVSGWGFGPLGALVYLCTGGFGDTPGQRGAMDFRCPPKWKVAHLQEGLSPPAFRCALA